MEADGGLGAAIRCTSRRKLSWKGPPGRLRAGEIGRSSISSEAAGAALRELITGTGIPVRALRR